MSVALTTASVLLFGALLVAGDEENMKRIGRGMSRHAFRRVETQRAGLDTGRIS